MQLRGRGISINNDIIRINYEPGNHILTGNEVVATDLKNNWIAQVILPAYSPGRAWLLPETAI